MKKIVLIGDIVGSRALANRKKVQEKINHTFRKINKRKEIASPYTLTLGDEFQAVYSNPKKIFSDILTLIADIHPVRVRFSIGIGEIATKMNRQKSIGMDGQAFYISRDALTNMKKRGLYLTVNGLRKNDEKLIQPMLNVMMNLVRVWKPAKIRLLIMMLEKEKTTYELAEKLGVSERAVYKNIKNSVMKDICALINEFEDTIRITQTK